MIVTLLRSGFTLEHILGEEVFKRGMTSDQMRYFFNAIMAVEAGQIDNSTMAYARVMANQEGGQKIQQSIDSMRNALVKDLIRSK